MKNHPGMNDEATLPMGTKAKQQHTPGPWQIYDAVVKGVDGTDLFICRVKPDGDYRGQVCYIQSCDHVQGISREEARANANLIKSSPELLACLQRWIGSDENESLQLLIRESKAAIAKATGANP